MSKIVYLIGAGASADALPLVKGDHLDGRDGLPEALVTTGSELVKGNTIPENQEYVEKLKDQFEDLAKKSIEFDTIDTYAKYCYLRNPDELQKIKKLLLIYFTYEQGLKKFFDKRYLVFLTTILIDNDRLPDNIKILSWNYDSQFQIASEQFVKERYYMDPKERILKTKSLLNYFPSFITTRLPTLDSYSTYSLLHLNGIAGYENGDSNIIKDYYRKETRTTDEFIKFAKTSLERYPSLIRFAWEREINPEKVITLDIAKAMVANTTVLVVIGYSFPFFNREIDREIINTIRKPILEKVYYQNLIPGDFLASQFDIDKKIIENVDRVNQFFVPPEF